MKLLLILRQFVMSILHPLQLLFAWPQ